RPRPAPRRAGGIRLLVQRAQDRGAQPRAGAGGARRARGGARQPRRVVPGRRGGRAGRQDHPCRGGVRLPPRPDRRRRGRQPRAALRARRCARAGRRAVLPIAAPVHGQRRHDRPRRALPLPARRARGAGPRGAARPAVPRHDRALTEPAVLTLLHASDPHVGPHHLPSAGAAFLRAAHELAPDAIVISGDFTQRAKRVQYAAAAAFLERLPAVPRVVVPGNHDVPLYRVAERIFQPYRLYREYISPELDAVHRLDGAVIVALNSTAPLRAITNGRIDAAQLDFCADALRAVPPSEARIVVAHHHFAPAPDYQGGRPMPRARRALDVFTALRVELVLGGHLHRAYIGNSLDVYPGRDREHGVIIVQCGTT